MAWHKMAKHWKKQLSTLLVGAMAISLAPNVGGPITVSADPGGTVVGGTYGGGGVGGSVYAAPGGVGAGLISWIEAERSKDSDSSISSLQDLAESSRIWQKDSGAAISYESNAINYNAGYVTPDNDKFTASVFSGTDTAREVFSVQLSTQNDTTARFPWDFGGANHGNSSSQNSLYGDKDGQGKIRTRFGSSSPREVTVPAGVNLQQPTLLNVGSELNDWHLSVNGRQLLHETTNAVSFSPPGASGYYLGAGHFSYFSGKTSEVLLYDRKLSSQERAQVNSYLALKYGLTLKNNGGTTGDYVFSNGTSVWIAADHAGYTNRVTAIAKDSGSGLEQKQSKSQEEGAHVTIAFGDLISSANKNNPYAMPNDLSAFVISDNNGTTTYDVAAGSAMKRMNRVFQISKTNWADQVIVSGVPVDQGITFQLDQATDKSRLLISSEPTFANVTQFYPLTDGKVAIKSSDLAHGAYFTFAEERVAATAPGGVSNHLGLWLRADDGVTEVTSSNVAYVSKWEDKSGNTRDFTQTTAGYRPVYNTSNKLINFNSGVSFDGSNDYLQNTTGILGNGTYPDVHVFAVTSEGAANIQTSLFWEATGAINSDRFQVHLPWSGGTVYWDAGTSDDIGRVQAPNGAVQANQYNLWGFHLSPTAQSIVRDGAVIAQKQEARNTLNGSASRMTLGSGQNGASINNEFNGQIGDFIIYTGSLTEVQKQQIQSYLAIKYGISLDNVSYLGAAGQEVWQADAAYNANIAGIARDEAQGLHQKQSRSTGDSSEFAISRGTLAATNAANTNDLVNGQFLLWGDNGKTLNALSAPILSADGQATLELTERIWKVQNTNSVGAVNVQVKQSVFPTGTKAEDLRFVKANDPSFAGAEEFTVIAVGDAFVVENVTLDKAYFTFAKRTTGKPFIDLLRKLPDVQNYAEGDGVITPAPNTTISSGGVYSDGYLKYEIEGGSTAGEKLGLRTSETPNRDAGEVSVVDGKVYLGYGQDQEPRMIGAVNTGLNGDGKALQIDLSTPLTNGDFSKGTEGWTVNKNRVVLGELASKTQGRAGIAASGLGAPYTITGKYGDGQTYTFQSDVPYGAAGRGAGTKFEGKETFNSGTFKFATTGQYLTLESNGNAPKSGSSYGSMFGPEAISDVFEARAGDTLAFDWSAQGGSDDYEIYGFLIKVNDNNTTSVAKELMYGRGKSQAWTKASGIIPEDGRYQFRFVAGSYDQTGGHALGAKLLIDNVRVFNSDVTAAVVQKLAGLVTYENRPFPRPLKKQDRPLIATVRNAEGETANDQMLIHLLGDTNYATPGGVSAEHMSLWLRGDKDLAAAQDSSVVSGWADQAGVNQFTVVGTPEYSAASANFNPAVTFVNTATVRQSPNEYLKGDREITYKDGFAVFKHRGGAVVGSAAPVTGGYGVGLFTTWNNYLWAGDGNIGTRHGFKFNDSSRYHLAEIDLVNSSASAGWLNGQPQTMSRLKAIPNIQFVPVIGGTFGGGNASNWNHFNGELAEVVLFASSMTADEKQRIESYLALKYGMTLKNANGTSKNYISSYNPDTATDTPIWTAASNAGYGHRITGIGRDDKSGLTQKQSKSQEAGALVTIAAGGAIASSNAANESVIGNLSFFTFSDDNGKMDYTGTIPEAAGHDLALMERKFKTQTINWTADAAVTLRLDVTDPTALHYLIVYTTEGTKLGKLTNGEITIKAGDLANGTEFTFAKVQKKELSNKLTGAKALTPSNYTPASWQTLQEQVVAADAVLASPTATQVEVDAALAALQQALNHLGTTEPQLQNAVTAAETQLAGLPQGQFTAGSVGVFQTALEEAKQALATGTATPEQFGQALAKLEAARAGLVDLGPLQAAKAGIEGEQLNGGNYTEASWQALQEALQHAADVLANPNATQAEVDAAKAVLEAARAALVGVDKAPLQAEVAAGEALVEGEYTPASWVNFESALAAAKAVLENPNATQAEVNTALANLQEARGNLVRLSPVLTDLGDTDGLGLAPAFDGQQYLKYESVVANSVYAVNLQPATGDGNTIKLFLNGQEVADSADWSNLPLQEGANEIRVEVTSPDGSKNDYLVRIYRTTGKLVSLKPSNGYLSSVFNPEVKAYESFVAYETESITLTPVSFDPEAQIEVSINGGPFVRVNSGEESGALRLNVGENQAIVRVTDRKGAVTEYVVAVHREDAEPATGGPVGPASGGGIPSTPTAPGSLETTVNGAKEPFATGTTTSENGRATTDVQVNPEQLKAMINEGNNQQFAIRVPGDGDINVTGLNAEQLKQLADSGSTLEVGDGLAIYPVPGSQIDFSGIADRLGNADLGEIDVRVKIKRSPEAVAEAAKAKAQAGGYELLVNPVDLELTFSHEGKPIQAGQLDGYAMKYIALPDGIDLNRITTGVVLYPDGTIFHVPTVVTKINERYYAMINDLRDGGTYSVIWNPQDFTDVRSHWGREAINNIAARLSLAGTGNNTFSPDRDITRSEFAAIVALGMGVLRQNAPDSDYPDVVKGSWDHDAVVLASEFGIVLGFEDGHFHGNLRITREQGIAMIARAYALVLPNEKITETQAAQVLAGFSDADEVSFWARDAVAGMIRAGIVEGKEGKLLNPQASMTRAETAALMQRLLQITGLINKK